MVANVLMTRYKEIRLIFNAKSRKNQKMKLPVEQGAGAGAKAEGRIAIELVSKTDERPLEAQFIPRLVEAHDLYLSQYLCLFESFATGERWKSSLSIFLVQHIVRIIYEAISKSS